jgi:hypothetical protein
LNELCKDEEKAVSAVGLLILTPIRHSLRSGIDVFLMIVFSIATGALFDRKFEDVNHVVHFRIEHRFWVL